MHTGDGETYSLLTQTSRLKPPHLLGVTPVAQAISLPICESWLNREIEEQIGFGAIHRGSVEQTESLERALAAQDP